MGVTCLNFCRVRRLRQHEEWTTRSIRSNVAEVIKPPIAGKGSLVLAPMSACIVAEASDFSASPKRGRFVLISVSGGPASAGASVPRANLSNMSRICWCCEQRMYLRQVIMRWWRLRRPGTSLSEGTLGHRPVTIGRAPRHRLSQAVCPYKGIVGVSLFTIEIFVVFWWDRDNLQQAGRPAICCRWVTIPTVCEYILKKDGSGVQRTPTFPLCLLAHRSSFLRVPG